ncbi:hypothetical protein lbkm_0994 [Lachnospiraceae bacterium KM106-2]|nr:hypothetical protein lbkm_0994 [Lachnospiraceae bacterium KM106-2]
MGKKKREHILFDEMRKTKKSIPFTKVNGKNQQSTIHRKIINK